MKINYKWLVLIIIPIAFLISFFGSRPQIKLIPQKKVVTRVVISEPKRLKIPVINVNAVIQEVGVNSLGEMDVPSNTIDVGWFSPGPKPGERGSAVIAGHVNGKNGEAGVFEKLSLLKEGDKVYVEDINGKSIVFIVKKSHTYQPGYADEVFSSNDFPHLNLITCDGIWDENKKSFSKRLVVFTDIAVKFK